MPGLDLGRAGSLEVNVLSRAICCELMRTAAGRVSIGLLSHAGERWCERRCECGSGLNGVAAGLAAGGKLDRLRRARTIHPSASTCGVALCQPVRARVNGARVCGVGRR